MTAFPKDKIIQQFSVAAEDYDRFGHLQKQTAKRMARALEPWQFSIPEGPLLEVGAGTGFFTEYLMDMYPGRELIISDASPGMLETCRKKFHLQDKRSFKTLDVETAEWHENQYAMIAGNFMAHWLRQPAVVMSEMSKSLKPGGFMLMSFPGSESFPQWKKYCLELGLPFTANPLPDIEEIVVKLSMGPVKVDYYEDQSQEEYDSVIEFFRQLKKSGRSTSFSGKMLSLKQLKLLDRYWKEQNGGRVYVHYHTAFVAVKRDL